MLQDKVNVAKLTSLRFLRNQRSRQVPVSVEPTRFCNTLCTAYLGRESRKSFAIAQESPNYLFLLSLRLFGCPRRRHLASEASVAMNPVIQTVSSPSVPASAIIIKEGKAILAAGISTDKVFYNPVQEFNRDLSCLVLKVFFKKLKASFDEKNLQKRSRTRQEKQEEPEALKGSSNDNEGLLCHDHSADNMLQSVKVFEGQILDAMAATGLRTCRYALEIPHVSRVVANDYDKSACEAILKNAVANGIDHKLTIFEKDARELMLSFGFKREFFHAVDLDPFGTAAPFFEGALQCIADGGILMVTCTDTAILCGNYPEACFARYGSTSIRNPAHHEISLRIVLNAVASRAMMHEKYIDPLLSVREGHYIRVFLAVHRGAKQAKENVRKTGIIFNCTVCHDIHLQPFCEKPNGYANAAISSDNVCDTCGTTMKIGGPIWIDVIHDLNFVDELIRELEKEPGQFGTAKLLMGKLGMVQEELPDQPLYVVAKEMFKVVHCNPIPSKQLLSAVLHAGYIFSLSHCERESLKTNAPKSVLWDIIRSWVKIHPINEERIKDPKISRILNKEPNMIANFTLHPDADFISRKKNLLRFPTLGVKGPMAKPKGIVHSKTPSPEPANTVLKRHKLDPN